MASAAEINIAGTMNVPLYTRLYNHTFLPSGAYDAKNITPDSTWHAKRDADARRVPAVIPFAFCPKSPAIPMQANAAG